MTLPVLDLLRRFEAAVSGMKADDLRKLAADVALAGWREPVAPDRPNLRRPPRVQVAVYRVRVDLEGARPPIWRRLDDGETRERPGRCPWRICGHRR